MSDPVRGVVVAHAGLARALIEAVDRIVGLDEGALEDLSNDGLGPAGIVEALGELVGDDPAIVFTDLREGSCGMAGRRVCLERADQVLITGVNLPMLLDFVLNRHRPLEELVEHVLERGRRSLERIPEPS